MLDRPHRLTASAGFTRVTRRGRRVGGSTLVVHYLAGQPVGGVDSEGDPHQEGAVQVGFVVSKAVGTAVVRNRVKRRLRHLVRERLAMLGPGSTVVVRALPPAAGATSTALGRDLDTGLRRLGLAEGPRS